MMATRTDEVFCDFRAASLASSNRLPQCEKSCSHPTIANHRGRVSYRRGRRASFRTAWVLPFWRCKDKENYRPTQRTIVQVGNFIPYFLLFLGFLMSLHPKHDGSSLIVPPIMVSNVPPVTETIVPLSVATSNSFFRNNDYLCCVKPQQTIIIMAK